MKHGLHVLGVVSIITAIGLLNIRVDRTGNEYLVYKRFSGSVGQEINDEEPISAKGVTFRN